MNEAILKQLEVVQRELDKVRDMAAGNDEEKRRISMLVDGTPDLHIRNPEQFAKMAPYADPKKPPFTEQLWQLVVMGMGDVRPTYEYLNKTDSRGG
jgi:hypothetical protein